MSAANGEGEDVGRHSPRELDDGRPVCRRDDSLFDEPSEDPVDPRVFQRVWQFRLRFRYVPDPTVLRDQPSTLSALPNTTSPCASCRATRDSDGRYPTSL